MLLAVYFAYQRNTCEITISLGSKPFIPPQLISPLSLGVLATVLAIILVMLTYKTRKPYAGMQVYKHIRSTTPKMTFQTYRKHTTHTNHQVLRIYGVVIGLFLDNRWGMCGKRGNMGIMGIILLIYIDSPSEFRMLLHDANLHRVFGLSHLLALIL